jgi:HEAT repeat protein
MHRLTWRARYAPELDWLYGVLGVGMAAGLLLLILEFTLDVGEPQPATHVQRAPMPALASAPSSTDAVTERALTTNAPTEQPGDDNKTEKTTVAPPPPASEEARRTNSAPPPEPPATAMKAPEPRRKIDSENELRRQLYQAPEFGLKPSVRDMLVEKYKSDYQSNAAMGRQPIFDASILLKQMPSVQQLPLRSFPGCQLPPESAVTLGVLSRALHVYLDGLAPKDAFGNRRDPNRLRSVLRQERRGKPPEWLRPEALPAMVQILMAEGVPLRLVLVDMMADIRGKAASVRLAQRAVFDLSPEVRKAAIDALRERPASEARRTLVDAMRYPWPPAADHAATALAVLNDRDAAPLLVALLDKPDPAASYATKAGAAVREIVRVNHVQNCLLCHVPAVGRDAVTDVDPFARRPSQTYQVGGYGGPTIPGSSGGGVWANRVLIRADVQFLRQDFSITFPAGSSFGSDGGFRFDFLARTRPLNPSEIQHWKYQVNPDPTAYRQREAVLYALRAITGQDAGPTTDAWLKLYPDARAEFEGVRMAARLHAALPEQREQLLTRYRDAKEEHYADWLAHAIPHVTIKLQEKVRAILVERLARLPADDLSSYLEYDGELRLAAIRACERKADPAMIPDLIGLLADADADVGGAALKALRRLTGQDFGPPAGCSQEEHDAAVATWQTWYHVQRQ